jgi:dTDP-4-dehydrorhamnose 3,5-epimerase
MADLIFNATPIGGLLHVERSRRGDSRGTFSRFFDEGAFAEAGWPNSVVQMNHTMTEETGTVRGMHFQYPPHGEWKYVSCLAGAIFDVAVDLRLGSPSFGEWFGATLSAENGQSFLIPAGFAHGFQTLAPRCELIYLHSAAYAPSAEGGVDALDPSLDISWPLAISVRSPRDIALPRLDQQTGS